MDTTQRERFEDLYRSCADRVFGYCLRHTSRQQAEDVVAEVFSVAWRKLATVPDEAMPWLLVTARNTILSSRRAEGRQRQLAERLVPLSDLVGHSPEVETVRRSEIVSALESLNDDDREAILLIAWDGLTTRDAARVLGVTPGALRVRLHRARHQLRAHSDQGAPA